MKTKPKTVKRDALNRATSGGELLQARLHGLSDSDLETGEGDFHQLTNEDAGVMELPQFAVASGCFRSDTRYHE